MNKKIANLKALSKKALIQKASSIDSLKNVSLNTFNKSQLIKLIAPNGQKRKTLLNQFKKTIYNRKRKNIIIKKQIDVGFDIDLLKKLRLTRRVKPEDQIIYQEPIANITIFNGEIPHDDFNNIFYDDNFQKISHGLMTKGSMVKYADYNGKLLLYIQKKIFSDVNIDKKKGSIQLKYIYQSIPNIVNLDNRRKYTFKTFTESVIPAARDENNVRSGILYTNVQEFNANTDVKNLPLFNHVIENANSNGYKYVYVGYRFVYATVNNEKTTESTLNHLKAFKPSSDRKYHELTCASTSTNKLCIYETFLDIIGQITLRHQRNKNNPETIRDMLKSEGSDIELSVKTGMLIKSLELLTKKYNQEILIIFYGTFIDNKGNVFDYNGSNENVQKPIIINNGITNIATNEQILKFNNKKYFLYDKNVHVAPAILNVDKIKKSELKISNKLSKKFSLRKQILKNSDTLNQNDNLLGFDTETYTDENSNCVCYCICLYGKLNGKIISESFYGENCLKNFFIYIENITTKINNCKARSNKKIPKIFIYGFNNSKFDNMLIYKYFFDIDPRTKFIFSGNSIKFIKYNNLHVFDISLFYKNGTLRETCKAFKLEKEKGVFPYKFVNKDNLYYIGDVPESKYWNVNDRDIYIKDNNNFDMKNYTIKYCLLDSELVYELAELHMIMSKGKINGRYYNTQKSPTSANSSIKMFSQIFQNETYYQSPDNVCIKERAAYKGGRTEKFKNDFTQTDNNKDSNLYYFDINSAYPAGMCGMMPYRYKNTLIYNEKLLNKDDIIDYNLYYAKSEYKGDNKCFIPNLLMRHEKTKDIISCKNTEYAYHWGCELKEAINNNCEIHIKEELQYEGKNIFKGFSEYFYGERLKIKNSNPALAIFYKAILNSLYGKFGQKPLKKQALCSSVEEIYKIINHENTQLLDLEVINDQLFFIKYQKIGDEYESIGKLIRFSSYISSTARTKLSKFMRDVGHENVYYCDTDSVFTSKLPSDKFIDQNILGKWKMECDPIKEAIFIAPKTYFYKTIIEKEKPKFAAKGMNVKKQTQKQYRDLLNGDIDNIKTGSMMFFRSFNGIKIIDNQIRTMNMVNNKRKWSENSSEPYNDISEWYLNKVKK